MPTIVQNTYFQFTGVKDALTHMLGMTLQILISRTTHLSIDGSKFAWLDR